LLALLLALLLTRFATGRLMWWAGIQLWSKSLPASAPVAAPVDSFPEVGSLASTFLALRLPVRVLLRLACGKSASIHVL